MSCAKQSENMDKNRYKDVLPCKLYLFFLPNKNIYHMLKLIVAACNSYYVHNIAK